MWPFSRVRAPSGVAGLGLVCGRVYHVVAPFLDHDGIAHHIGESWRLLSCAFLPYEDGLTLEIERSDGTRDTIRLQRRPETEGPVIAAIHDLIKDQPADGALVSLLVTRDSVCLADDIDAPHARLITVAPDANAQAIALAIVADNGLASVMSGATWEITLQGCHVVFGRRLVRRFVHVDPPGSDRVRAADLREVHARYHAQRDPDEILRDLREARDAGGVA